MQITDPFGQIHSFFPPYRRIVSLIPSITESLFEMGAGEQVIAVTYYCLSPARQTATRQRIGGTKDPDIQAILRLEPDLVIANVEENRKEDVDELSRECTVYLNYPKTLNDVRELLQNLAALTGKNATRFLEAIDQATARIRPRSGDVLYLIWKTPYWGIGDSTYISDVLRAFGYRNVWSGRQERYFPISDPDLEQSNPDLVLLPSEPYRFRQLHAEELALRFRDLKAVRSGRVLLLDGRMSSWFGTRTARGIDYLNTLLP